MWIMCLTEFLDVVISGSHKHTYLTVDPLDRIWLVPHIDHGSMGVQDIEECGLPVLPLVIHRVKDFYDTPGGTLYIFK